MPRFTTEQIFNSVVYNDVVDKIGGLGYNIGDVAFRLNRALLAEDAQPAYGDEVLIAEPLINSFLWENSTERFTYWESVHEKAPRTEAEKHF